MNNIGRGWNVCWNGSHESGMGDVASSRQQHSISTDLQSQSKAKIARKGRNRAIFEEKRYRNSCMRIGLPDRIPEEGKLIDKILCGPPTSERD